MIAAVATPPRLTTRQTCDQLGISRATLYRRPDGLTPVVEWFTPYQTPGGDRRFCALEVGEAAQHLRGADGRAKAHAAVLRLRKAMGRLT